MEEKKEEEIDLTLEALDNEAAVVFLGWWVANSLKKLGQVTLIVNSQDKVAMANPVHVFIGPLAFLDESEKDPKFRWVRPILGQGTPQTVAWRDGELWEIELIEEIKE